ncbi:unnamed protein product [Rhodiola kirilowii]
MESELEPGYVWHIVRSHRIGTMEGFRVARGFADPGHLPES